MFVMLKRILCCAVVVLLMAFSIAQAAKNDERFVARMKAEAEQGDALAQAALGDCYYFGTCEGVPQDCIKAREFYEKAVAHGLVLAQFNLGWMYYIGEGVQQNYDEARKWFEKAAAQGYAKAQNNLGVLYMNGQGVRQDKAVAKEWFGKACDNGNQKACDTYRQLNESGDCPNHLKDTAPVLVDMLSAMFVTP